MPDYKAFAVWCLTQGPWSGCDLDGGDVQAKALELGIIKQVPFDPKIHDEEAMCDVEPGDPWFSLVESA
jgi:hypothetical protein